MFRTSPISARTYLVKALRGYKDNSRHGYDATMAENGADQRRTDFGSRLLHRAARGKVMLNLP
jgi:hypothetical protein